LRNRCFRLGGSFGHLDGTGAAALIVVPFGQPSIAWFSSIAFLADRLLWRIGVWYRPQISSKKDGGGRASSRCAGCAGASG
jgi:FSR family fosmidomycin resistance protein-like MFS transporter